MKKFLFLPIFIVSVFLVYGFVEASELSSRLKGKILLKVEDSGKAYYINPKTESAHYLGRPDDAFQVMREQGIGITNVDLEKIPLSLDVLSGYDSDGDRLPDIFEDAIGTDKNNKDTDGDGYDDKTEILGGFDPKKGNVVKLSVDIRFAEKQKGKILLQVENNGEAWYVNPSDGRRYFLGRPDDAFSVMRNLGLGISNKDFNELSMGSDFSEYKYSDENFSFLYSLETEYSDDFLGQKDFILDSYLNYLPQEEKVYIKNRTMFLNVDYFGENFFKGGLFERHSTTYEPPSFYAYKNDEGSWAIVHRGHGPVSCSVVDSYDFPVDLLDTCWDGNGGGEINRNKETCGKTVWFNIDEINASIRVGEKLADQLIYHYDSERESITLSSKILSEGDSGCLPENELGGGLGLIHKSPMPNQPSIGVINGEKRYYSQAHAPCVFDEAKVDELLEKFNKSIENDCGFYELKIMDNKVINILYEEEEIIQAFLNYNKKLGKDHYDNVELYIDPLEGEGNYLKGRMLFVDKFTPSAPSFLAAKIDGEWVVTHIGQDTPLCTSVDPYDYPAEIVPECFSVKNVSVVREDKCTKDPEKTAIGRSVYPIEEKYGHLDFLGQIFTARDCGEKRLESIFGVENGIYNIGSTIFLNSSPEEDLILVLEDIGYECVDEAVIKAECKKWRLESDKSIENLLKLEPFSSDIFSDDCVNCG